MSSDYKLKIRDESYRHQTTLSSLAIGEAFEHKGRLYVKARLGAMLSKAPGTGGDRCACVRFGTFDENWEPHILILKGSVMVERRKATLEVSDG